MANYRGNPAIVSAGEKSRFARGDGDTLARRATCRRWEKWRYDCWMANRPYDENDPASRAWVIAQLEPSNKKELAAIKKLLDE